MTDEELIEALRGFSSDLETDGHNAEAEIVNNAADRLEVLTQPSGKVSDEMVEQISRKVMLNLFEAELEGDAESEWHRVADIVRAALEAAQLPARPVVRPLEWSDPWPDDKEGDTYTSANLGLVYHVQRGDQWSLTVSYWGCGEPRQLGYFSSLDEAKAAAQADYERRILSALEGEGE